MLYDVHTHVGLDTGFYMRGWWPYSATVQDLLQLMDANGIDRAVCFPFVVATAFEPDAFALRGDLVLQPDRVPYDYENRLLVQECQRIDQRGRLLPFAMFDPSRMVDEQMPLLEPLVGHIAGLKTQTEILRSPITDLCGSGKALMQFAEKHDLPVLIHTSVNPSDTSSLVEDCLAVAQTYPNVRFNLAHSLRYHEPHLRTAATMKNVWVDCSAHLVHCHFTPKDSPMIAPRAQRVDTDYTDPVAVLKTIHAILGDRYLWGSDNPYMSWHDDSMAAIYSYKREADVLHALPADVKADMATHGPRAWLGQHAELKP